MIARDFLRRMIRAIVRRWRDRYEPAEVLHAGSWTREPGHASRHVSTEGEQPQTHA